MRTVLSIVISYGVACLFGGAVAGALLFLPGMRLADYSGTPLGTLVISGLRSWATLSLLTALAALLPFAIAVALLRWQRIGSLIVYTLAGAVVSMIGMCILDGRLVPPQTIIANWPIIVAGAIAGFVYRLCEKLLLAALSEPVRP